MDSERKWTKGPWERSGDLIGCYIEPRREWSHVATTTAVRGFPDEEAANARLIVAAPALFEALDAVLRANAEFRRSMPADWEGDPLNDACEAASAALSLAQGESKP